MSWSLWSSWSGYNVNNVVIMFFGPVVQPIRTRNDNLSSITLMEHGHFFSLSFTVQKMQLPFIMKVLTRSIQATYNQCNVYHIKENYYQAKQEHYTSAAQPIKMCFLLHCQHQQQLILPLLHFTADITIVDLAIVWLLTATNQHMSMISTSIFPALRSSVKGH